MSMSGYFGGLLLWLATTIEKALRRLRGGPKPVPDGGTTR